MALFRVTFPQSQQGNLRSNTLVVDATSAADARIQAAAETGVPAAVMSVTPTDAAGAEGTLGIRGQGRPAINPDVISSDRSSGGIRPGTLNPFSGDFGNFGGVGDPAPLRPRGNPDRFANAVEQGAPLPTGAASRVVSPSGIDLRAASSSEPEGPPVAFPPPPSLGPDDDLSGQGTGVASTFRHGFDTAAGDQLFNVHAADGSVVQRTKADILALVAAGASIDILNPGDPSGGFTVGFQGGSGSNGSGSSTAGTGAGGTTSSVGGQTVTEGPGQFIPPGTPGSEIGLDIQDNPFATFQNAIAAQGFNPTGVLGGSFNNIFNRIEPALQAGTNTGFIPEIGESPGALQGAFGAAFPSASSLPFDVFMNLLNNRDEIAGRGGVGAQFVTPDLGSQQGIDARNTALRLGIAAGQNRLGGFAGQLLPSQNALQNRFDRLRVASTGDNAPDFLSFISNELGF